MGYDRDDDVDYVRGPRDMKCCFGLLVLTILVAIAGIILIIFGAICVQGDLSSCGVGGFGGGVTMIVFGGIFGFVGIYVTYHTVVYITRALC